MTARDRVYKALQDAGVFTAFTKEYVPMGVSYLADILTPLLVPSLAEAEREAREAREAIKIGEVIAGPIRVTDGLGGKVIGHAENLRSQDGKLYADIVVDANAIHDMESRQFRKMGSLNLDPIRLMIETKRPEPPV